MMLQFFLSRDPSDTFHVCTIFSYAFPIQNVRQINSGFRHSYCDLQIKAKAGEGSGGEHTKSVDLGVLKVRYSN